MKAKAIRVRAIVEFFIELEDFMTTEEDEDRYELMEVREIESIKDAEDLLLDQCVKVKSGELENQIYGDILSIESIEKTEVDIEAPYS
jgi:hypothetical protein